MVKIRLTRGGVKKRPFYQIIVTDNRNARDGYFIERIGFFNPIITNNQVKALYLNMTRLTYWIFQGAAISKRVLTLIKEWKKQQNIC